MASDKGTRLQLWRTGDSEPRDTGGGGRLWFGRGWGLGQSLCIPKTFFFVTVSRASCVCVYVYCVPSRVRSFFPRLLRAASTRGFFARSSYSCSLALLSSLTSKSDIQQRPRHVALAVLCGLCVGWRRAWEFYGWSRTHASGDDDNKPANTKLTVTLRRPCRPIHRARSDGSSAPRPIPRPTTLPPAPRHSSCRSGIRSRNVAWLIVCTGVSMPMAGGTKPSPRSSQYS